MITWEKFQASYAQAPQSIKDILDSEQVFNCVSVELSMLGISAKTRQVILEITYDILQVRKSEEIITSLHALGIVEAQEFLGKVKSCLGLKNSQNQSLQATTLNEPAPHVAKLYNENTGDLNINDEIAAVEQEIETLQGLRTMKADMRAVQPQAEIIHTASSQADILARPPQAPGNVRSDGPRWDTEA